MGSAPFFSYGPHVASGQQVDDIIDEVSTSVALMSSVGH